MIKILHTHPRDYTQTWDIIDGEYVPLAMCKGGSKAPSQTTTTTQINLPSEVKSLVPLAAEAIQSSFEGPAQQAFAGERVADLTPTQQSALDAISAKGLGASPIQQAAEGQLVGTLGGEGFGQGFDDAFGALSRNVTREFQEATLPSIRSSFVGAGRTGRSGLLESAESTAQQNLVQQLGDIGSTLAQAERGRQIQALALAPNVEASGFANLQRALQAGGVEQAQTQAELGATQEAFEEARLLEQQKINDLLNRFNALAGPFAGATTQVSSAPRQSPNRALTGIGAGLSGAATGAQIGSIVPGIGTGIGAAVGGGLGLLGGLFG